jgi:hypothetical protein
MHCIEEGKPATITIDRSIIMDGVEAVCNRTESELGLELN